jgi:phosphohistidine phosphatase SixA
MTKTRAQQTWDHVNGVKSKRKPQVAQLVKPDGTVTQVSPSNGKKFTLAELQAYVDGYIELVRLPNAT